MNTDKAERSANMEAFLEATSEMFAPERQKEFVVNHAHLVEVAARWLQSRSSIVVTELGTTGETPDAIGWKSTHSILVECKVSRADFLADRHKSFRQTSWQGIGTQRYFLALQGIIKPDDLPAKWGLFELRSQGVRMVRESEIFEEVNSRHEIGILLSTIRRIGPTAPAGTSIKFYTFESKNRATLGVEIGEEYSI